MNVKTPLDVTSSHDTELRISSLFFFPRADDFPRLHVDRTSRVRLGGRRLTARSAGWRCRLRTSRGRCTQPAGRPPPASTCGSRAATWAAPAEHSRRSQTIGRLLVTGAFRICHLGAKNVFPRQVAS